MKQGCRLAVVADGADTHTLLEAVLSPRGHQVTRVRRYADLQNFDSVNHPKFDLVVMDADHLSAESRQTAHSTSSRQVVLGTVETQIQEGSRLLTKPFQVAELLSAIESLLPTRTA